MLDESDDSGSDSASEDAESGSHVSEVYQETRTADHETGVKRKVDTRTTANASTERPSAPKEHTDLSSSLHKTREEDRKKGRAISRQIASQFHLVQCL
jgi:protein AATF/BFR2